MRIVLRDAIRGRRTASWTLRGGHFRHLGDRQRLRLRVVLPLQGERKRRVPRILDCEGDCAAASAKGRLVLLRRRREWGRHEKQQELKEVFCFVCLFICLPPAVMLACIRRPVRVPRPWRLRPWVVCSAGEAHRREETFFCF